MKRTKDHHLTGTWSMVFKDNNCLFGLFSLLFAMSP